MKGIKDALISLSRGEDLKRELAIDAFEGLFQGEVPPVQAGAFLLGLKAKGETPVEILSAVEVALSHSRQIDVGEIAEKCIDTCGTGGDGKGTFNCSTAVSLYLADMGYKVVKHGNRAISGKCGSADVIKALGLPFVREREDVIRQLVSRNFVFLFAPYFHPAFSNIAPVRQELGIPTIFNIMGPLLNPVSPPYQLLGVGDRLYMEVVAEVLRRKGVYRAAVVHGDGFDEITPTGETEVLLISKGEISHLTLSPQDFGIARCREEDLRCRDRDEAISLMEKLLMGTGPQPMLDMIILNLGMALFLLEEDISLQDAMSLARHKVARGVDRGRFYAG